MTEKGKTIPLLCIKSHGYEYYLIEVTRDAGNRMGQPCFMGHPGMALHSCKKIENENNLKKNKKK
jgi:hypothetical protein